MDRDDMSHNHIHLEGRYSHLDGRVAHLDSRVNEIATDMAGLKTSMDNVVRAVGVLTDRATNPSPTNWVGIGSLLLALMVGGAGFVSLRMTPIEVDVQRMEGYWDKWGNVLQERGAFIAEAGAIVEYNSADIKSLWVEVSKQREEIIKLRERAAAAEVSRKAIGDYAREMHRDIVQGK